MDDKASSVFEESPSLELLTLGLTDVDDNLPNLLGCAEEDPG